jgi:ATP-dependent RNA helicase DeaD
MESVTTEAPAASPLPECTFNELISDKDLLASLERLGLKTPTPVQQRVLPEAIKGKDLVVQARTGSGKTFAFAIPMLLALKKKGPEVKTTFGLIVTPTRELATQICHVVQSIATDVAPVCLIGGVHQGAQVKALGEDRRIIVGTPGRILDLLRQREIVLRDCEFFALDEADEMLSMGFIDEVRAILSRMPEKRQGLFISATATPRVDVLASSFLHKPERINVVASSAEAAQIEHCYVEVGTEVTAKAAALCDIIETQRPRSAIIFCNTKSDTELAEVYLRRRGFDARRINSDLSQKQRDAIMNKLRAQDLQFLIGTDVAARGLDIEQIDLVVNYALDKDPETYVHRTGRTGRAGRSGRAITLVAPQDAPTFYLLKKNTPIEFVKLTLPTEAEIAEARLAHFYEILRERKLEVEPKGLLLAKKLLLDLGGIAEPQEELSECVAKLYQLIIEHVVKAETKSLDESLDEEARSAPAQDYDPRRSESSSYGRGRDSGRSFGGGRGGSFSRGPSQGGGRSRHSDRGGRGR